MQVEQGEQGMAGRGREGGQPDASSRRNQICEVECTMIIISNDHDEDSSVETEDQGNGSFFLLVVFSSAPYTAH